MDRTKSELPFASHSNGFRYTEGQEGCYCVLVPDRLEESHLGVIEEEASKFLREPAKYIGHKDAGDFAHGEIAIVYCMKESAIAKKIN